MNRRAKHKKKSKLPLTITLTLTAILMTAVVVWIGINDWDIEKSLEQIGVKQEEAPESVQEDSPQLEEEPSEEPGVTEEEPKDAEEAGEPEEVKPEEPEQPKEQPAEPAVPAKPEKKETPKTETKPETKPNTKPNTTKKPTVTDDNGYITGQTLPDKPTYINGILIANKKYPLPSTYAPGESKDARAAFDEMAAEAKLSNINLTAFSTYRSYDYQVSLYDRYVKKDGKAAADRYSARPGYSEHQTGLAFDIGEENNQSHWASSSFGETVAGKWVADNAHRYGFILRYPKGKEAITGYMHEAWHFRYVGEDIATDIYNRNITLEEYLGIK